MREWLNIDQSPEELNRIYGDNYYHYLSSVAFRAAFYWPIGEIVNEFKHNVLDVGCGEGQLSLCCLVEYLGIDGSEKAIEKARQFEDSATRFRVARFEDYRNDGAEFGIIVFGGIMEVLVKPQFRVPLMEQYLARFRPQHFIVYDLERLDTTQIDARFRKIKELHRSAVLDGIEEVKKHRKILVYETGYARDND